MRLYLVRHAVAYDHGDTAFPNDDDRTLTPRGRKQFEEAARGLLRLMDSPGLIITSPLPRAAQTAAILRQATGDHSLVEESVALLPSGSPDGVATDVQQRLSAHSAASVEKFGLALVGHAPAIDRLATWLLAGSGVGPLLAIRKGGVACIDVSGMPEAGAGSLAWLLTRRMLQRLSR
jgi:phosphohistidine phosphatase